MASAPSPQAINSLADRHRQLRTQVRWLMPVGTVLLVLLVVLGLVRPSRVALTGYRFGQVGIQADTTWWLLAYHDNKAELLFRVGDTSRGWQRHSLGVPASEARRLALDWGGKALLLGNSGTVRVYDAQFQLTDSVQKLDSWARRQVQGKRAYSASREGPLPVRAVLVDRAGRCAVVIGSKGQVYFTSDGGKRWNNWRGPGNEPAPDSMVAAGAYVGRGFRSASARFCLAAPAGYYTLDVDEGEPGSKVLVFSSYFTNWAARLQDTIAWCGTGAAGLPWAMDRRGNWARQDTAGQATDAQDFLAKTVSVAPLDSAGNFLGVSTEGLYQQAVASALIPKVRKRPADVALQPSVGRTKPLTGASASKPNNASQKPTSRSNGRNKTLAKQLVTPNSVQKPTAAELEKQRADQKAQEQKDLEEKRKAYEQQSASHNSPLPVNPSPMQSPVQQLPATEKPSLPSKENDNLKK